MPKDALALMEETKKVVTDFQGEMTEKTKELGGKVAEMEPQFQKMEDKFGELSESLQEVTDAKKSADQRIKDLELVVSRGFNKDDKGEIETTQEIKGAIDESMRLARGTYAIKREIIEANFKEHVAHSFGHLTQEKQALMVKNLLAEGSESAGGMWCPVPMDSRIRRRVFETSPMRQVAEVMNISSQAMDFALDDEEAIATEAGEVDVRNENDVPEFGQVKIQVHNLYSKPKATLNLLEDNTINLESWLSGKTSRKFARKQNKAFIVGDEAKEAKGILTYEDAAVEVYERNKIGTMETAASGLFTGDDLIDLQSHLLEDYQSNASWMLHRLQWARVIKLKDDQGQYLLNPAILFAGAVPQLLGAQVRMAGDMPSTLTTGNLVVTYGDFREGYTILDRLGIGVIRDNITESGFVKWYFRTRYGGGVTNFQALKRLKIKA